MLFRTAGRWPVFSKSCRGYALTKIDIFYRIIKNIAQHNKLQLVERKGIFCRSVILSSTAKPPPCISTVAASTQRPGVSPSACLIRLRSWKPMPGESCVCAKTAVRQSAKRNNWLLQKLQQPIFFMYSSGVSGTDTRPAFPSCCRAFPLPRGRALLLPSAGQKMR